MPILAAEADQWPADLILRPEAEQSAWWAMYTRPRQEKKLMRMLREESIDYYSPVISRRYRSRGGRLRQSHEILFTNYVFVRGDEMARYNAVCTGCISQCVEVLDRQALVFDLRQIYHLIATGEPIAPEEKLVAGDRVRVRNGVFKGFEGTVIRRENSIRLLISVRYMGRGASVALDDCQVDKID